MSLRALSCQKEKKEEGADKRYREVVVDTNKKEEEDVDILSEDRGSEVQGGIGYK